MIVMKDIVPTGTIIFRYDELKKFFTVVNERYRVFRLDEWDGSNGVILRHDVDLSVRAAYDLASLEKDCGIRASYFFLTTSHAYNPASPVNRRRLQEMVDWGFEIGLHFDTGAADDRDHKETEKRLDAEAAFLSSITQVPVKSISLHNPSVRGKYPLFEGYLNAYDPRIFSPTTYLSDSRMKFQTDLAGFIAKAERQTVQLLLHPMHYSTAGGTYKEIFYAAIEEFLAVLDEEFRANDTYAGELDVGLFTYLASRRAAGR